MTNETLRFRQELKIQSRSLGDASHRPMIATEFWFYRERGEAISFVLGCGMLTLEA
ncbi:hypothetical protein [Pseudanabaena sp. UWO311]|uniref:hypothetical protein n=1 Tax=Pseudanabaena sp. UWO311 TaxID=2487337 RepID=UPI00168077CA|nr:hypothetical protein [Pseudanabaena sp. UWO311]